MTNREQIEAWNGPAGDTWVAMQAQLDRQLDPLGLAAIAALAPRPGERIADIGCGAGHTTHQLAGAVGPSGRVVGLDVSAPLLAAARARTTASNVEFVEGDAQVAELAGQDAVFSRFGVMFFADPVAAFANLHRALRPGGRLAFVCWRALGENPLFGIPLAAARAAGIPLPAPGDPHAPGPMAFADPARVRDILERAGFEAIAVAPHDETISSGGLEDAVALGYAVGPLSRLLREHGDHRPAAIEALRVELVRYVTDGIVQIPSATWIVTATA